MGGESTRRLVGIAGRGKYHYGRYRYWGERGLHAEYLNLDSM